ncbi:hypothetical protein KCP71_15810 [Salmonella enterica subsp. enterica]|nr:hypothetical protein KCP71_15810 [Salmonella enterica subsp. enterica]
MLLEKRTKGSGEIGAEYSAWAERFRRWIVSVWAMLPASVRCLHRSHYRDGCRECRRGGMQ